MPGILESPALLGIGTHALCLHATLEEAEEHAVEFLEGTPEDQAALYWVPDSDLAEEYDRRILAESPRLAGSVFVLPHPPAESDPGPRRPTAEMRAAVAEHPEGLTAADATTSRFWTPPTIPEYLESEAWFDGQPRARSRFLCPYDLRQIPPALAPRVLRDLGDHHSHVILSHDDHPAVQLMQLFVFGTVDTVPDPLQGVLRWALAEKLLELVGPAGEIAPTLLGDFLIHRWNEGPVPYR